MTVGSILEEKGRNVFTMSPDASLLDAVHELGTRRIGALVLLADDGRIAGILSERDIVRAIATEGKDGLNRPVSEVMTANVRTCTEAASVDEVMGVMTHGRFRHMPVAENGRLVGIVSIGDVVKRRIEAVQREAEDMRSYIAEAG